jgi:hypothetical protein
MMNLNIITLKPVFVQSERKGAKHDGQPDQHPLFARHTSNGLTLAQPEICERGVGLAGIGIQHLGQPPRSRQSQRQSKPVERIAVRV